MIRGAIAIVVALMLWPTFTAAERPVLRHELERPRSDEARAVVVTAIGAVKERRPVVHFEVTNLGESPFLLPWYRVPWNPGAGVTLVALTARGRVVYPRVPPDIEDVPLRFGTPVSQLISAGGTISGDLELPKPLVEARLHVGTVLTILWAYGLPLDDDSGGRTRTYSGLTVIPWPGPDT
jgi:hypothetical protein